LEEDFLTWKKALWQPLCELFNLEIVEDEEESFEVYAFFLLLCMSTYFYFAVSQGLSW